MELSQLRFKVFHKPGTAMGHVDGLSRLYTETVGAITMQELLNEAEEESLVPVGERPTVPTTAVDVSPTGERTPRVLSFVLPSRPSPLSNSSFCRWPSSAYTKSD
ncbi:hypothetical protein F441_19656 [Phytophthora nicotianae CJ01A1]|uniref:Uncharacterized protein n=1 Tax=Phytophthora nicotianae CJ01A1 TaxID=1317063 RepID=W2VYG8_PHYNI|nr:hypothetical protein F441_19656 [Phytophthora nicotianae CJ01A1]